MKQKTITGYMTKLGVGLWVVGLASCGEYWTAGDPVDAGKMTLARESIDLMVGDSYEIPVIFEPQELSNDAVSWMMDNTSIATVYNGMVKAVAEGTTTVYALSVSNMLTATCQVNVWPRWFNNPHNYPYDMVVYANITLHGQPLPDNAYLGAFIHGELCGVAQTQEWNGHRYTYIRIWNDQPSGGIITFRHYDPTTATMQEHRFWMDFDGDVHGKPSIPYDIELEDDEYEEDYDQSTI